ncbi:cytochrome c oxidase subunit II [Qipengyuania sp. MTN3-11]|uniref:cytochrome c oxidase subunit II n=1 Tax=Qipengyuania sp. MTN3-11 TaxID=3056557 RepID=UPI0036F23BCB
MSTSKTSNLHGNAIRAFAALMLALLLAFGWQAAKAQEPLQPEDLTAPAPAVTPSAALENVPAEQAADVADPDAVVEPAGSYDPMAPTAGKGMPVDGRIDVQEQFSDDGRFAQGFHIALVWVMAIISAFVLALLIWVVVRYNRRANPTPSKTTHNTMLEVVWTLLPVLILVAIAIPSISLLARQYETPPEDAITVKATGYQWYWGYTYPDNGGFEIISNMMDEAEALANGEPPQLAVDNRLVLPVGVPIRLQTTGADVIHSFAIPSLWFKIDAVPGRLNERLLQIEEPGVYYGQCSELCGARHAYMPIAIEALPMEQWREWVLAQGGTFGEEEDAAPELAPVQEPESAEPGAPGAGAAPTEDTAPTA